MANDWEGIKKWGSDNLTGVLAIIAGLILLGITYKVIISLIFIFVGIALIYFGLARLKIKTVTNFIDNLIEKLKTFISLK
ncbi:hypothetical protein KAT08_00450 [Candidatus Babeliales bacterium]|nr:hypothetical protein [Candidatus Babeliales bacterium]